MAERAKLIIPKYRPLRWWQIRRRRSQRKFDKMLRDAFTTPLERNAPGAMGCFTNVRVGEGHQLSMEEAIEMIKRNEN